MVHFILSHSYIVFLIAIVLGVLSHMILAIELFTDPLFPYIGFAMIILGSALVYWSQATSNSSLLDFQKTGVRNFARGPYKYSRNPTHIGLTIMTLGLALVLNSFFIALFMIIASLITKFIFLRQEEALLEKRYGQPYRDYKKQVSTWV